MEESKIFIKVYSHNLPNASQQKFLCFALRGISLTLITEFMIASRIHASNAIYDNENFGLLLL